MSISPGDVIDHKYRVVRLIGEGGMGAVYEGENTRISRRVAIKVLRTEAANRPELAARFEREARAAAKIGSKHVCDVLDLGDLPNGDSYLVMEFLDGEDLASRLKTLGRMPDAEALAIAYQLTDGLATMHEAGIIHRDLKPANVFLALGSRGETVKILDFGVSKFSSSNESLHMTATGAVMGTPLYMSPEQARGAKDIDARSDLYAVGVVLYKAVTGKLPFKGDNFNEILFKIALEVPPRVLELAPDVDPGFAEIIERAMAKEPAERYQTARDFQDALRTLATARGLVLEQSISIPPTGSLTPGRGVTPLTGVLPPPSKLPTIASPSVLARDASSRPRRPSIPPVGQMQEIVADGFTATAWAGSEPGSGARSSVPDRTPSVVSVTAATEHATPPVNAGERGALLTARLEEENRRASARTQRILMGAGALVLALVGGGVLFSRSRAQPSITTETSAAQELGSAKPVAEALASAAPASSSSLPDPGVAVGALPLVTGSTRADTAGAVHVPVVQPGALPLAPQPGGSAPAAASQKATAAGAAPSALASSGAAPSTPPAASAAQKPSWGVIAPAVPTVEKSEKPAEKPSADPAP
jgi:serine/threonine-protein kinase